MRKSIILEKFGFNVRVPGSLNELQDKKVIKQIEASLFGKPIQIKKEAAAVCILMSGAELVRIQLLINNNRNNELAALLASQAKLTKDLAIKIGNVHVAQLIVDYDTQQRRFVVYVET
jgi:hypothetical protein